MNAWVKLGAALSPRIARTMRCATALMSLGALALVGTASAGAAFQPLDLSVDGGEESWHAKRTFVLRWSNPPQSIAAVHYRVLDPAGQVAIGKTTLGWAATALQHLSVPSTPGAYTAQVWLEDTDGNEGTPVAATLRFDNAAPGRIEPPLFPDWIGRTAFPYTLHLGHPAGAAPLSGIRGYAASVDGNASGGVCPPAGTCDAAQFELQGSIGADLLTLAELPEGTNYLHAVAVSGSGTRSAIPATSALHVDKTDPEVRLAGDRTGWSNRPLTLTATASDSGSGMVPIGGGVTPFTAIRIDDGAPAITMGDAATATVIASGIHTVAYYARDLAGNVADGGTSHGQANHAPATTTVRLDREPPRLAFAGGQDPLDPERIEARASDALSGLDSRRGSIGVRRAGSGEPFVDLHTELSGALLRARWDSEAQPPGEYEFRATVYDQAGNAATSTSRVDGSAMRLGNPLKVRTTLLSDFVSRTLPYGRGAPFSGHLLSGRRTPLAAVPVRVIERFDAGAVPRERVSIVHTDGDGAFSLRLNRGPSRQILAVAPPTATLRGASSQPLRLGVRSGVRLRASSKVATVGGRPVVFRGKVIGAGATIPDEGKTVQLQFRLPGLPWSEFRTIRTDPRGDFRYAYRFADDDSRGVRFQFRAYAPAQAGWPFEPAGSPPVSIAGV
jgi:uncharacterized Zn-binding protein involved in type VI secretion